MAVLNCWLRELVSFVVAVVVEVVAVVGEWAVGVGDEEVRRLFVVAAVVVVVAFFVVVGPVLILVTGISGVILLKYCASERFFSAFPLLAVARFFLFQ